MAVSFAPLTSSLSSAAAADSAAGASSSLARRTTARAFPRLPMRALEPVPKATARGARTAETARGFEEAAPRHPARMAVLWETTVDIGLSTMCVARREVAQVSDVDGSFGHVSAVSQVPSVS